jgi:uncharacterized protein DUF4864
MVPLSRRTLVSQPLLTPGRAIALSLLLALLFAAGAVVAQSDEDVQAAIGPVMQQLEAFRRDDYDTAYTFASEEVRKVFDRQAFERMVKRGYPEIARSTFALVAESRVAPNGHVYLRVKVRGANGNSVEALYDMVREGGRWRINGVVARPDPGFA